jgi:hypothetical protein
LNASLYFSALAGGTGTGFGMTANLLAAYYGATGLASTAGTGATNVIGIANSSIGSPYGGVILSSGIGTCIADNTVTIGNLIGVGTTTAGRCKDLGTVNFSAVSQALQIVGVATTGASAGGTFTLQFFGPGYYGTSVALGSTGTTGTITGTVLAGTCDSGTASVTGAMVGHPVAVSSTTGADMGGAFNVRGSVTSTGTVTVYVCGTGTPASLAYNVTVF